MLVNDPSFSVWAAAGRKKSSVRDLLGLQLARLDLRAVVPERGGLDLRPDRARPATRGWRAPAGAPSHSCSRRRGSRRRRCSPSPCRPASAASSSRRSCRSRSAASAGQPLVLLRRVLAEVGLHQADPVRREVAPAARRRDIRVHEVVERPVVLRVRHRQVAGEDVVERRDVGRALDRRVAAEREDAAARTADVPEQLLDDRRRADDLDADRVLRPADRVAEGPGALAARVLRDRPAVVEELLDRASRSSRPRIRACSGRSAS